MRKGRTTFVTSFSDVMSQGGFPGSWKDPYEGHGRICRPWRLWHHRLAKVDHSVVYLTVGEGTDSECPADGGPGFSLRTFGFNREERIIQFPCELDEITEGNIKAAIRDSIPEEYRELEFVWDWPDEL